MSLWELSLSIVSTLFIIAAVFFSLKLSRETKGKKYWFFFVVAALSIAVFHGVRHPWAFGFLSPDSIDLVQEVAEIVGAFSLAYACFGLYSSMKRIRKKMAEEL